MRIPCTVKVGAARHRVVWQDAVKDNGETNLGIARVHLNRIEISRYCDGEEVPESSLADTFLHELVHAISITYGLNLAETQVAGVAGGLLAAIRDNDLDFRKEKKHAIKKGKESGKQ